MLNSCLSNVEEEYRSLDIILPRQYKGMHREFLKWNREITIPENIKEASHQVSCKTLIARECQFNAYKLFDTQCDSNYRSYLEVLTDTLRDWKDAIANQQQEKTGVTQQSELESVFIELAKTWRRETALFSSVTMMAMHPAYQRIIGMGKSALPLILRELQKEADHWFWALSSITGENPVDPADAGDIMKMRDAWLNYGKRQGYIE